MYLMDELNEFPNGNDSDISNLSSDEDYFSSSESECESPINKKKLNNYKNIKNFDFPDSKFKGAEPNYSSYNPVGRTKNIDFFHIFIKKNMIEHLSEVTNCYSTENY